MLAALAFAANALSDHEQQHPTHQRIYFGDDHQSYVTTKTPPQDDFYRYPLGVGGIAFYGMIVGVLLLIARGTRKDETFALQPPRSWPNALALTGAVLVVTYTAVVLLGLALGPEGHPDQGLPTFWDGTRFPQFALSFIAIAVIAPVVEELAFRGLGFSLLQPYGTRAAIGGTAVLFGLIHGYLIALPIFILVGVALAWLRSRTDSVYPGMLMHSTFNATSVALTISFS
jgi:membrane protease YdiL (CAAX protease family)